MIRRTLLARCLAALTGGLLAPLSGCEGKARFHINIDSRESRPPVAPARPPILPPGRTTHLTIVWADTPAANRDADRLTAWVEAGMPMYGGPAALGCAGDMLVGVPGHSVMAYTVGSPS
jgi:L-aminopeptidase/D-esterase-like protein